MIDWRCVLVWGGFAFAVIASWSGVVLLVFHLTK